MELNAENRSRKHPEFSLSRWKTLYNLHHPIFSPSSDFESGGEVFHTLMMERIHRNCVLRHILKQIGNETPLFKDDIVMIWLLARISAMGHL